MRMPQRRKWTEKQLVDAVKSSESMRSVLIKIGLKPAGGNYSFISSQVKNLGLDTSHFKGKAWNKGKRFPKKRENLDDLLVQNSNYQSYKLKKLLFQYKLKQPKCELCSWADISVDGRLPLELDHINGDRKDNRLVNLRILCPNCHSLQPTHRGRNKYLRKRG